MRRSNAKAIRANAGGAPGKPQSATTPRRRAWRVAACRGAAASDHRRRRIGQDLDAGAPRRLSDRTRRRSAPHHAADILAAGGGGNDAAGRSHPRRRHARERRRDRGRGLVDVNEPGPARSTPSARGCCANMRKRSGLRPAFTIHDREDSADLMNLVRHDLGFSQNRQALSGQGHLPRHLFARGERRAAARRGSQLLFSVVRDVAGRAAGAVRAAMSRSSSSSTCSITTTSCSIGRT